MTLTKQIVVGLSVIALVACAGEKKDGAETAGAATASGSVDLTGAGATFPNPIYQSSVAPCA